MTSSVYVSDRTMVNAGAALGGCGVGGFALVRPLLLLENVSQAHCLRRLDAYMWLARNRKVRVLMVVRRPGPGCAWGHCFDSTGAVGGGVVCCR